MCYFSSISMFESNVDEVSVGFFEDMWIPITYLPQPTALYVTVPNLPILSSEMIYATK